MVAVKKVIIDEVDRRKYQREYQKKYRKKKREEGIFDKPCNVWTCIPFIRNTLNRHKCNKKS
jgi:hypothetical protein